VTAPSLDPALHATLRVGLAVLLLAAAWHKLRDLPHFTAAVEGYRLLPTSLARLVAPCLAALELGVALSLLVPAAGRAAGFAAAGLLVLYGGAIAINLARGRAEIDCGCAGPTRRATPLSAALVARNAVLALCALACALPVAPRSWVWLDGVSVAGGVAAAALLYAAIDLALAQRAGAREVSWSTP
jgi:uncharacterized membrane protein YphA (DoxX/SURF4 family)